ncbi:MAG TPA: hypothetical protein ENN54_05570, partial [Thermoplasmatales archaeon]|nr:hypothetical protein [Thermoplasmatales archaeon]
MKRGVGIALLVVISLLAVGILSMGDVHRRGGQVQAMPVPEGKLIFVDDDFTDDPPNHKWDSITKALNDADDGDVIFVFNGRYEENIFVGHSVHLLGGSQANVVIDGGSALYAVNLLADGIIFENVTVTNGQTGIYVANGYKNINISRCTVTGSARGLDIRTSHITVANCTISDVHTAIRWEGSYNIIADTVITEVDWGVRAHDSEHGTIEGVEARNVENKSIVLESSENMTVRNCLLHDSFTGIWLEDAHHNLISTCDIHGNKIGIRLDGATHNHIASCALSHNLGCGVYAEDSYFNVIHHNNFLGNGIHAYDTGLNHWNTSIGNYWDDYTGSDEDGNGIGDIPYLLGGNSDHRPLAHVISDPPSYVWVDDDFNASSPGWQIDHFAGIQAGVAAAAPGGTVYVYNGSYGEGLNITVPLTVRGEPGATLAAGQDGVFITASDVELTGLSITAYQNGIKVQQAHNILIHDCHVSQAVFGLYLVHTADCSVTTSSFFGNTKGIYLFNATSTLISGTRIHNNSYFGVELGHGSSGNVLSDCHLADNANYGLYAMHNTADNAVYHNNFINNGAYDAGANVWGGLRREVLGNYWSRHDGPDADHDGMIDHAYAIPGGDAVDWFPLKNRISDSPAFVWVNPGFAPSGPGWSGDHFTTLSEAVAALQTGGGCYVFAGSYHDRVIINQSIWMTGEDPVNTTISGDGGGALVISGGGARVERLGVHDCWNDAGVYISGDDVLLANCSLYDNYYG